MSDAPDQSEEELSEMLSRFASGMRRSSPFEGDRELLDPLGVEVQPVLEAVLASLAADPTFSLGAAEHGETFALVTLLGRRAATLGISPTGASNLTGALLGAIRQGGVLVPQEADASLSALAFEGYVAGRGDVAAAEARARVARAVAPVEVVSRLLLLPLAGDLDEEVLTEAIEEFGRALFKVDAVAAVVDLRRLEGPTASRALEVFAADRAARLLGARCWFVAPERWLEVVDEARVERSMLSVATTLEEALTEALPLAGRALRPTSWIPGPLKTLWRKKT